MFNNLICFSEGFLALMAAVFICYLVGFLTSKTRVYIEADALTSTMGRFGFGFIYIVCGVVVILGVIKVCLTIGCWVHGFI